MDYTHAAYFQGAHHQPYHFIGMPPLTPSHSTSGPSEDYNTTSPPEVFGDYSGDHQFAPFDAGYAAAPFGAPAPHPPHQQPHHPHATQPQQQQQPGQQQQPNPQQQQQQQPFPGGPLTPPNAAAIHGGPRGAGSASAAATAAAVTAAVVQAQAQALNGGIARNPHVVRSQQHPVAVSAVGGNPSILAPKTEHSEDLAQTRRGGSNSEEDDLTPAQSKRKAQNRAAQRAFRERKERHVKDLEAKLLSLQAAQEAAATENERLKRDLQKMSTENEILRATGGAGGSPSSSNGNNQTTTGPMTYNPTDFYSDVLDGHSNKALSHRITTSDDGERLYAAGATWDFIIGHELFQKGLVDIADISNRLKSQAKCDGQGPVFEESAILEAIEHSVASGSDTLI